jgi:hypothetical protein
VRPATASAMVLYWVLHTLWDMLWDMMAVVCRYR